jgi:hypothetical protein
MEPKDKRIKTLQDQVVRLQDEKIQLQNYILKVEKSLNNFRSVMAFYRGCILRGMDKTKLFCEQIPNAIYREYTIKLYEQIRDSYQTWNPLLKWLFKREVNNIISTYKTMIDEQPVGKKETNK